ncbi:CcmD family protein [Pelolinea submarina]|uniref:CcmD family protein n=1 Tax=Pelolinea submarina TaxID=913107 RepID=A0A3E0AJK4_9CHLR|nr:CcmD family protein [Pelolinea submarina]REG11807.1 CcmD family protein [Pelolinea submarina]
MNYLILAYALIFSGIIGYQVSLFVRAKKLENFLRNHNKLT